MEQTDRQTDKQTDRQTDRRTTDWCFMHSAMDAASKINQSLAKTLPQQTQHNFIKH